MVRGLGFIALMRYLKYALLRYECQPFLIDSNKVFKYSMFMAKISYNTRMEEELIKQFKILAIEKGKRQNELLEEAIKDILKKYRKNFQKS